LNDRPSEWGKLGARSAFLFLATAAYILSSLALLAKIRHHAYSVLLIAQYVVLLPVFLYTLSLGREGDGNIGVPRFSLRLVVTIFLVLAAIVSWQVTQGIVVPDESAYRFQGAVFASGHLWADAPPGAGSRISEVPPPLYFEHILLEGRKWYSQYPPLWPAVLAPTLKVHGEWLLSPLFGALLLIITAATSELVFGGDGRTGPLAASMMALSPYYLTNSVGIMTHAFCGVIIGGAIWLCFKGLRLQRLRHLTWMFGLLSIACLTRYFTGAVMSVVLGLVALWCVRRNRTLLVRTALVGALFAALILGAILTYNYIYTGGYLVSPYSLVKDTRLPFYAAPQLVFDAREIWYTILHDKRWGVQRTLFYAMPFLYVLAGYAVLREPKYRTEVRILALLSVCLVVAYQFETEDSAAINGERYYFEVFGAVAMMAARGLALLLHKFGTRVRDAWVAIGCLMVMQTCPYGVAIHTLVSRTIEQRQIRVLASRLTDTTRAAFLSETLPFPPKHFQLNGTDWRSAKLMFMVDPGPAGRQEWACRMGRSQWVIFGYDPASKSITQQFGSVPSGRCPQR
jgi:hypothetical protein